MQARARIDLEATSLPLPRPLLLPIPNSILYCRGPLLYLFEHPILCLPIFNHLPLEPLKTRKRLLWTWEANTGSQACGGSAGIPRPRDWYGKVGNGLWVGMALWLNSFLHLCLEARAEEAPRGTEDGPQTSSLPITWELAWICRGSGPSADSGDQTLHFNKVSRWLTCTFGLRNTASGALCLIPSL